MFPCIAMPKTGEDADQTIIINDGTKLSGVDFFKKLGLPRSLRLKSQVLSSSGSPPRITWQHFESINQTIVSIAYPFGKDTSGRSAYAALIAPLNYFNTPEEIKNNIPINAAIYVPDIVLKYMSDNCNIIKEEIVSLRSKRNKGGELDISKAPIVIGSGRNEQTASSSVFNPKINSTYIATVLIASLILLVYLIYYSTNLKRWL